MILHEVTYDDGDYYCEGSHLVGVFTTQAKAEEAIKAHLDSLHFAWLTKPTYAVNDIEVDKVYT